jgi:hypothetical protein
VPFVAREAVERARLGQSRGQLLRKGVGREEAHVRQAQRPQTKWRRHSRTLKTREKPQLAPTSPANADEGGIGVAHDVGGDCAPPEGVGGVPKADASGSAAVDVAPAIDSMAAALGWAVGANMTVTKASGRPSSANT